MTEHKGGSALVNGPFGEKEPPAGSAEWAEKTLGITRQTIAELMELSSQRCGQAIRSADAQHDKEGKK